MQEEWENYQLTHAKDVILEDKHDWNLDTLKYVGGLDVTFSTSDKDLALGCLVICEYPSGKELLSLTYETFINIPYIPTFLGFREVGIFEELLKQCKEKHPTLFPQVVLVDGNGYCHPRRFGSATHLGYECNIPTVGVAKVEGIGKKEIINETLKLKPGNSLKIQTKEGEVLYSIIRSGEGKNPIIVSCGNMVSLDTSVEICKKLCLHKIPEPIRLADLNSRRILKDKGLLPHLPPIKEISLFYYGDSNLYGMEAETFRRYSKEHRFCEITSEYLKGKYQRVEWYVDGMPGRELKTSQSIEDFKTMINKINSTSKNRRKFVILSIIINDILCGRTAKESVDELLKYIKMLGSDVEIIVMIPPVLRKCTFEPWQSKVIPATEESKVLNTLLKEKTQEWKNDKIITGAIDLSDIEVGNDGTHYTEQSHSIIAERLKQLFDEII